MAAAGAAVGVVQALGNVGASAVDGAGDDTRGPSGSPS
jgi:hypothetical protein